MHSNTSTQFAFITQKYITQS